MPQRAIDPFSLIGDLSLGAFLQSLVNAKVAHFDHPNYLLHFRGSLGLEEIERMMELAKRGESI